jgi:hypothetical protein
MLLMKRNGAWCFFNNLSFYLNLDLACVSVYK